MNAERILVGSGVDVELLRARLSDLLDGLDDFYPKSAKEYEQARHLLVHYSSFFSISENLSLLTMCAEGAIFEGKLVHSLYLARIGAKFAYEHQQHNAHARLLNASARTYVQLNNAPAALRDNMLSVSQATEHRLYANASHTRFSIGGIYFALNEINAARTQIGVSLSLAQQHGLHHLEVVARNCMAMLSLHQGDHHTALDEIKSVTEIVKHHALQMPRSNVIVRTTHGQIMYAEKEYDEALAIFENCRTALTESPVFRISSELEFLIARVLVKLGREEEAVRCLESSAAYAREAGMNAAEARAMLDLSKWHAKRSGAKEAVAAIESFERATQANKLAQLESTRAAIRSVEQIDIAVLLEQKRIEELHQDIDELPQQLSEVTAFIREATVDGLTGALTRRGFEAGYAAFVSQASTESLNLMMIDVDGYRVINKAHGHLTGDIVLREIARRLRGVVGSGGLFSREGGDRFLFLSSNLASEELRALAERLSHAVSDEPIAVDGLRVQVGVSIGGVSTASAEAAERVALIEAAAAALKEAKQQHDTHTVIR
jgi:diguanylate cyclase (GGDEF)-like protein